jgi:hypothetical protein
MLKWRALQRLCSSDYLRAVSAVQLNTSSQKNYHHEVVTATVHTFPTKNDLKLGFSGIGALLAAFSAASVTQRMVEDEAISDPTKMSIDPLSVVFTKTEYPIKGLDALVSQFPTTSRDNRQGLWFITLRVRPSQKDKFVTKRPLIQRCGGGAYLSRSAAMKDVINHRLQLEGLEELSPGCWAQNSVTPK